jgi:hypothetical protein
MLVVRDPGHMLLWSRFVERGSNLIRALRHTNKKPGLGRVLCLYGGERGIRTLSHAISRLAMPPNALEIKELKNEPGIRGHQKAWVWSHGGPIDR